MKIISRTIVLTISFLYLSSCSLGQKFQYQKIPKDYFTAIVATKKERDSVQKTFNNPYFIINALPKGFVRNGKKDYTSEIQKVLDEHKEVVFPDFPILINEQGLSVSSNTRILFGEKSQILLKSNEYAQYEILRIHDVNNVSVYFANIVGDRYIHKAKDGEWGMGISIRGTRNVLLFAPQVKQCWGDGIYLGMSPITKSVINENVIIYKALVDNNRRNGMSIISAQNLRVNKFIAANTSGTPPHAGIDVEPDNNTDIIKNITLENVLSYNNETHGLLFVLGRLAGKVYDIGTINIKNFKADTGYLGISFRLADDNMALKYNPKGSIIVENVKFSNLTGAEFLSYDENVKNNIDVNVKLNGEHDIQKIMMQLNNSNKIRVQK